MKKTLTLVWISLCMLALAAHAQYRWRDADGAVGYGDEPPPGASAIELIDLPSASQEEDTNRLPYTLRTAMARFPVVLYTTDECAACTQVRAMLMGRGVPFAEKTISTQKEIAQLKDQGLGDRLPVITVGRKTLREFSPHDLQLELTAAGYPEKSVLPPHWKHKAPQPLLKHTPEPASR